MILPAQLDEHDISTLFINSSFESRKQRHEHANFEIFLIKDRFNNSLYDCFGDFVLDWIAGYRTDEKLIFDVDEVLSVGYELDVGILD